MILWVRLLPLQAQSLQHLHVHHVDSLHVVPQGLFQSVVVPDTSMITQRLHDIIASLHQEGYLAARVDSLHTEKGNQHAFILSGAPYKWHVLATNVEDAIFESLNLTNPEGKDYTLPELQKLKYQLISYFENNGYPFARITMDQISIEETVIKGNLVAEPMAFYSFDTLQLSGNLKVNARFLANHTAIAPGMPYNQQVASKVGERLSELPFLKLAGEPSATFMRQKAVIIVPVVERRTNRFDGIAGLSGTGTEADPYRLTGLLNLSLINALERGESVDIRWQGMGHGSQRLEVKAGYPYVFSSPITAGIQFSLHKQDSTYITVKGKPWFAFRTATNIHLSAFADFRNINVLGSVSDNPQPQQVSSHAVLYGMELLRQSPGFSNTFRQGQRFRLSVAAGNRNVRDKGLAGGELLADPGLRQNQFTTSMEASIRFPLAANLIMVSQLEASGIFAKRLYENELYRIGGFQSLKGFDEESIIASSYGVLTQELRYFTGEMSYVSLLFNGAWFQKDLPDHYQQGWPWGMAAGISLETAPGILSVYYALGKQPEEPFNFRKARIHFGFISLF